MQHVLTIPKKTRRVRVNQEEAVDGPAGRSSGRLERRTTNMLDGPRGVM